VDFTGARDDGAAVASAGPYGIHLHLAPDHDSTSPLRFYRSDALSAARPNQQRQSTEGWKHWWHWRL